MLSSERKLAIARIIALLIVIAISLYIYSIRDQAEQLAKYGYPGIFLLSILANATVLLPAPGVLFVFAMGAIFDPFWVAIASGAGAALGELSGYLAGFSGQAVVENKDYYERIRHWMETHQKLSDIAIAVLAFIPNPLFDLAGMAAGTLKIHLIRFLFFCLIGKILKMMMFSYAGASSINILFSQ